jgi:hypothetical protein
MVKCSRILITTVFGFVFGILCLLLTRYTANIAFWPIGISYLISHTVMGFAIGVSSFKLNWAVHGILWGALFGLFTAIGAVGTNLNPFVAFLALVVWGFLIELIATKGFKKPQ